MGLPFTGKAFPLKGEASRSSSGAAHSDIKRHMSKGQLIDSIRQYNVTAQPQFLAQFDEEALKQYLEHLEGARQKHLRQAGLATAKPAKFRMVS
jgi:hypothetical protein